MTLNFERIIVIGDLNVDIKCKGLGSNNISDFCDLFHLKSDKCFTKIHTSLIDLILIKKPSSFDRTLVSEAGQITFFEVKTKSNNIQKLLKF